ncbi:MAG: NnrU family protein [Pseudomonadota bacterium]|nr:NnrU family protein [Pseudomonadota bacterium]
MVLSRLVFASVLFLISHLGISSTSFRQMLIERLGRNGYLAAYSIVAVLALGFMILSYADRPVSRYLWLPSPAHWWSTYVLVGLSFVLAVGAFSAKNPTSLGKEGELETEPRGVICITRHPFQWAVVLWVVGHMTSNGDVASLIFFGTFGLVSIFGTYLMDMRMAGEQDRAWAVFAARTSNIPFGAIATGRVALRWNDLWLPTLLGLAVYVAVFVGHGWITGVGLH